MIACRIAFHFDRLDSIGLPCFASSLRLLLFYLRGLLLLLMLNVLRNLPCIFHNQGQMQILLIRLFPPLFDLLFIFLFLPMLAFLVSSISLIFSRFHQVCKVIVLLVVFNLILLNKVFLLVVEHLFNHFLRYFNFKVSFFVFQWLFLNFLFLVFPAHFLPMILLALYFF